MTAGQVRQFLDEPDAWAALRLWFGAEAGRLTARLASERLTREIARIDRLIDSQLNEILHHPRVQQLEASWRGLQFLTGCVHDEQSVLVRLLHVTKKELSRDAELAAEFDRSYFYRKVYSEEFDQAGGYPFGVLLGDYQFHLRPTATEPDDIALLSSLSQTAALAFTPFIAAPHPSSFGVQSFAELDRPQNLAAAFAQQDYLPWNAFRQTEESRFVGLLMPRVLARVPYRHDPHRVDGFAFHEDVSSPDRSRYLWGSPIYAFGSVLIRAFSESGWLADIRGVRRGELEGGVVAGLAVHCFGTDALSVMPKGSTDLLVDDIREKELAELGFIALAQCPGTELSCFYSSQSVQRPRQYDKVIASTNAQLSSMLHSLLCASRFAHYLKIMGRDLAGSLQDEMTIQDRLQRWLTNYVADDTNASAEVRRRYPLRQGKVQVDPHPMDPGRFICTMHLLPHFQIEDVNVAIQLKGELTAAHGAAAETVL